MVFCLLKGEEKIWKIWKLWVGSLYLDDLKDDFGLVGYSWRVQKKRLFEEKAVLKCKQFVTLKFRQALDTQLNATRIFSRIGCNSYATHDVKTSSRVRCEAKTKATKAHGKHLKIMRTVQVPSVLTRVTKLSCELGAEVTFGGCLVGSFGISQTSCFAKATGTVPENEGILGTPK